MLVLTRKPNQSIRIGDSIKVTVVRVKGNAIQLGLEAPKDVRIMRTELLDKKRAQEPASDSDVSPSETLDKEEEKEQLCHLSIVRADAYVPELTTAM